MKPRPSSAGCAGPRSGSRARSSWRTGGCSGRSARRRRAGSGSPSICSSRTGPCVAVEGQPADGRLVEAGQAVEDGGLAGAVRADDRGDLALARSKDRSLMATRPPKRMVRCSTSSSGAARHPLGPPPGRAGPRHGQADGGLATAEQAARPPDHDRHHGRTEQPASGTPRARAPSRAARRAPMAASTTPIWLPMPPSTTMARMMALSMKVKLSGADEALAGGEERAGEAAEHGAEREGGELGVGRVDAQRLAGDLVLAQRLPGPPDRQAAQAQVTKLVSSASSQDQEVEEDDPVHGSRSRCRTAGGRPSRPRRGCGRTRSRRSSGAGCRRCRSGRRSPRTS